MAQHRRVGQSTDAMKPARLAAGVAACAAVAGGGALAVAQLSKEDRAHRARLRASAAGSQARSRRCARLAAARQLPGGRRADHQRTLPVDGVGRARQERHPASRSSQGRRSKGRRGRAAERGGGEGGRSCRRSRCPACPAGSRWRPTAAPPTCRASANRRTRTSRRPTTPGKEGDVIHVLRYSGAPAGTTGRHDRGAAAVRRADPQAFPPKDDQTGVVAARPRRSPATADAARRAQPRGLCGDDRHASRNVRYVKVGGYPYGAAIAHDGSTASSRTRSDGTVSRDRPRRGDQGEDIPVGPHLSHPEEQYVGAPRIASTSLSPSGRMSTCCVQR